MGHKVIRQATTRKERNLVRKELGMDHHNRIPILVEHGRGPPRLDGSSFYWTNKTGERIKYPKAYRNNYGKPIYHKSTLRIVVGRDWLRDKLDQGESHVRK